MDGSFSRRDALRGLIALPLLGCGGSGPAFEACDDPSARALSETSGASAREALTDVADREVDGATFDLGVASGQPSPGGATLWTHATGEAPLQASVWEEGGGATGSLDVTRADGGYVHVRVGGLAPATRYRYAFTAGDGRSAIGRFKTSPAPDAQPIVRLAGLSCVSYRRPHDVLAEAAERDHDLLLALGDSSYNDGARTLCEFRQAWRRTISSDGWRALRARGAQVATWDDHELKNDFAAGEVDPEVAEAARRSFFENLPIPRLRRDPTRIWRRIALGRTADVFVLDCRSDRLSVPLMGLGGRPVQMLGPQQMRWLTDGLRRSRAAFKVIMTSVPMTQFPFALLPKRHDRWESYEDQRRELLELTEGLTGVLWVGGDLHCAVAGRLAARPDRPGGRQLEVLVGPGAQRPNDVTRYLTEPQFDFSVAEDNVTYLELDPSTLEARIRWMGRGDRVLGDLTYDLHHGARLVSRG